MDMKNFRSKDPFVAGQGSDRSALLPLGGQLRRKGHDGANSSLTSDRLVARWVPILDSRKSCFHRLRRYMIARFWKKPALGSERTKPGRAAT